MNTVECHEDFKSMMESIEIRSRFEYALLGEPRNFAPGAGGQKQQTGDAASEDNPVANQTADSPRTTGPADDPNSPGSIDSPRTSGSPNDGDPAFLPYLETELYSRFYVRPSTEAARISDALTLRDFTGALSSANTGTGSWEPGWKIVEIEQDGSVAVAKDQVTFWVPRTGLRTRAGRIRKRDYCRVWVAKELRQLVPGFYFAIGNGNQTENRDSTGALVRFYWNLTAAAAVQYMGIVTGVLNRAAIPFRTKVISDPSAYVRADSGVLYIEQRHFQAARLLVRQIHHEMEAGLRDEVPMFSKRLARGLGLAEDPDNGLSFGQSRCRVVARALWMSHLRGITRADERLALLAGELEKGGINARAPYLNSGSTDSYVLQGEISPVATGAAVAAGRQDRGRPRSGKKRKYKAAAR